MHFAVPAIVLTGSFFTPGGAEELCAGPFIGFGEPAFAPRTLGELVRECDQIAVCRLERFEPQTSHISFRSVTVIKTARGGNRLAAKDDGGGGPPKTLAWDRPGQSAVVFLKDLTAFVCFGPFWIQIECDEESGEWKKLPYSEKHSRRLYVGDVERLAAAVRSILAGKEVVLTAEYLASDYADSGLYHEYGEAGRIWRVKGGLKIDRPTLSPRSKTFVGWGALAPGEVADRAKGLKDPDPWKRSLAVAELGSVGPAAAAALPALWTMFADPEPRLRLFAAVAAVRIAPEDPTPALVPAFELGDPDPAIRAAAARALTQMRGAAHPLLGRLREALRREADQDAKRAMVEALGDLAGEATPAEREAIVRSLARVLRAADGSDLRVRYECLHQLFGFRGELRFAAPELMLTLRGEDPHLARDAAQVLARRGSHGVKMLASALRQKSIRHPAAIIEALDGLGDDALPAVSALRECLTSPSLATRGQAAEALARIDPVGQRAAIVPVLRALTHAEEQPIWRGAGYTLVRLGLPSIWTDAPPAERRAAMWKLVHEGGSEHVRLVELPCFGADAREAVPELWRALQQSEGLMRKDLIIALWKLDLPYTRGGLQYDPRPRLLEFLREELRNKEAVMRYWAAETVREFGPEARPLIPDLRRLIKDEDEEAHSARIAALEALGAMGTAAAGVVPDLLKLLDHEDPSVESQAALALLRISKGNPVARDRLIENLINDDDWRWLWHVTADEVRDQRFTPILLKGTRCGGRWVAQRSIELLRAIDPELARLQGLE